MKFYCLFAELNELPEPDEEMDQLGTWTGTEPPEIDLADEVEADTAQMAAEVFVAREFAHNSGIEDVQHVLVAESSEDFDSMHWEMFQVKTKFVVEASPLRFLNTETGMSAAYYRDLLEGTVRGTIRILESHAQDCPTDQHLEGKLCMARAILAQIERDAQLLVAP